ATVLNLSGARAIRIGDGRVQEAARLGTGTPAEPVVLELRVQPAKIERGAAPGALVLIPPVVRAAEDRSEPGAAAGADVGYAGLDVVDAPAVPIVGAPGDQPESVVRTEPGAGGPRKLGQRPAVLQVGVAA